MKKPSALPELQEKRSDVAARRAPPPPPRPSSPPLLQTLGFIKDPLGFLAATRKECGDIFSLRIFGMGNWVFLCTPELAQKMLRGPDEYLSAGEANLQLLSYLLGPDSTISLDGPPHQFRRGVISPHLNGKAALQHVGTVRTVTERAIAKWPRGTPFSLMDETKRISLEVLFRVVMNIQDQKTIDDLVTRAGRFFGTALSSPLMVIPALRWDLGRFSPWGRILLLRRKLYQAIAAQVDLRRQEPTGREDVLSALVAAVQPNGDPLSTTAIVHELVNLISAGQETTSKVMAWTIFGIISSDHAAMRLRHELESVLRQRRPIEDRDLASLDYLEAVIHEGIRFRPLGPFIGVRRVKKPFQIDEYVVPEGAILAHCFSEISKDSRLFAHIEGFHPENFLGKSFKGTEWSPFGGGKRMCLGRGLAMVELKTALATIFQNVELEARRQRVKSIPGGFSSLPERGLQVQVKGSNVAPWRAPDSI